MCRRRSRPRIRFYPVANFNDLLVALTARACRPAQHSTIRGNGVGIIRLFLALIVAADHFRDLVLAPLHIDVPWQAKLGMNAGFAVMYFYMISGFLISGALANKYPPTPGGTCDFYLSRAIRIFALYWPIALIVATIYPLAQTDLISAGLLDRFTKFFLIGVDWRYEFTDFPNMYNLALYPGSNKPGRLGTNSISTRWRLIFCDLQNSSRSCLSHPRLSGPITCHFMDFT